MTQSTVVFLKEIKEKDLYNIAAITDLASNDDHLCGSDSCGNIFVWSTDSTKENLMLINVIEASPK
jgi:hypothetical protein